MKSPKRKPSAVQRRAEAKNLLFASRYSVPPSILQRKLAEEKRRDEFRRDMAAREILLASIRTHPAVHLICDRTVKDKWARVAYEWADAMERAR